LISVVHEEGDLNDLRAILGNDVAIKAYREGKLPFQGGTIIARLAWSYVPLEESSKAFGRLQSFVAGPPKNGVQFMVKNLKKYTSTGGWGFTQFNDGKPADEAVHNTCFSCHEAVKARDFVFARYARMARLDHRTDEDHRSADQSHGAWRQRIRCVPSGDSVNAGLRILRQTDRPPGGMYPTSRVPGSC
jgi:hypothetical protein